MGKKCLATITHNKSRNIRDNIEKLENFIKKVKIQYKSGSNITKLFESNRLWIIRISDKDFYKKLKNILKNYNETFEASSRFTENNSAYIEKVNNLIHQNNYVLMTVKDLMTTIITETMHTDNVVLETGLGYDIWLSMFNNISVIIDYIKMTMVNGESVFGYVPQIIKSSAGNILNIYGTREVNNIGILVDFINPRFINKLQMLVSNIRDQYIPFLMRTATRDKNLVETNIIGIDTNPIVYDIDYYGPANGYKKSAWQIFNKPGSKKNLPYNNWFYGLQESHDFKWENGKWNIFGDNISDNLDGMGFLGELDNNFYTSHILPPSETLYSNSDTVIAFRGQRVNQLYIFIHENIPFKTYDYEKKIFSEKKNI